VTEEQPVKKSVTYVLPPPEVFDEVARAVCETLSAHDERFSREEVASGLSNFLSVVARIHVKHLNMLTPSDASTLLDTEK
jgi:hypothetical protein